MMLLSRFFRKDYETPLHQAVLDDEEDKIRHFFESQQWIFTPNALGFTPLELACFLGKKNAIRILQPNYSPRRIKVVHPQQNGLSIYSEEDFEGAAGIAYYSHLRFTNYESLKEVVRNCPWLLKSSFLGEDNRELGDSYRKQLHQGFVSDVVIQWIDGEIGYGLFTAVDIPPDTYIGEYTGLVRRLSKWKPDPNAYCFHYPTLLWSWKYYIIDALKGGNELRFANHSEYPTLMPACLVDRGLLHLAFFTKHFIPKGTELTFNYGKDYWRHRKKRNEVKATNPIKGEILPFETGSKACPSIP